MTVRRTALVTAATLILFGCTTSEPSRTGPRAGTGWSRAPDMSVYAAMDMAGDIAREQEILCRGRSPASVEERWRYQFGAREDWITAALAARYGDAAVTEARSRVSGRERCTDIPNDDWRRSHARLLRLLELRLYPKDYWPAG